MVGRSAKSNADKAEKPSAEVRPFPTAKQAPENQPALPAIAPVEEPVALPPPATAPSTEAAPKKKRSGRVVILPIIGLALLAAGGWYGYKYWTVGRFMTSTDDAYIQADMAYVSPKITGYVGNRAVEENQAVKAGQPLVYTEDGDYRIALDQAQAQIATQDRVLDRIAAQTDAAKAALQQAEAQRDSATAMAENARRTFERNAALLKQKVYTQSQVDDAKTALDQATAGLASADAQVASARANIAVLEAQHAETRSTLKTLGLARDKAARDLSFTVLRAPYDGTVGNIAVEQGDLVAPGQKLAAVVPLNKLYIVANFKETQLATLAPGEKVNVSVDALSEHDFVGTVSSLAPASGAVFSLLPPENATGNFTKVVQRVPVRIEIPADVLATGELRAGLSVIVDADSRTIPGAVSAD